jgi:hypothetical protein
MGCSVRREGVEVVVGRTARHLRETARDESPGAVVGLDEDERGAFVDRVHDTLLSIINQVNIFFIGHNGLFGVPAARLKNLPGSSTL